METGRKPNISEVVLSEAIGAFSDCLMEPLKFAERLSKKYKIPITTAGLTIAVPPLTVALLTRENGPVSSMTAYFLTYLAMGGSMRLKRVIFNSEIDSREHNGEK